jgi:hypothetical protein
MFEALVLPFTLASLDPSTHIARRARRPRRAQSQGRAASLRADFFESRHEAKPHGLDAKEGWAL